MASEENFEESTETATRLFPRSMIFLAVAAFSYFIQTIPLVSLFTTFLLGPVWPMVWIYAAGAGIAIEAATKQTSRWWVLVPLLPLIVYEGVAAKEHLDSRKDKQQNAMQVLRARHPFDPRVSSLVVPSDSQIASDLIERNRIPIVYDSAGSSHRLLTTSRCDDAKIAFPESSTSGVYDRGRASTGLRIDGCSFSMKEAPPLPQTVIAIKDDWQPRNIVRTVVTTIRTPSGDIREYTTTNRRVLSWFPYMYMGCSILFDGSSSRRCGYEMDRERMPVLRESNLGYVLGLIRMDSSNRIVPSDPIFEAKIDEAARTTTAKAYSDAEDLLSGRWIPGTRIRLAGLAKDPVRYPAMRMRLLQWFRGDIDRVESIRRCRDNAAPGESCGTMPDRDSIAQVLGFLLHADSGLERPVRYELSMAKRLLDDGIEEDRRLSSRRERERRKEDRIESSISARTNAFEAMQRVDEMREHVERVRSKRIEKSRRAREGRRRETGSSETPSDIP